MFKTGILVNVPIHKEYKEANMAAKNPSERKIKASKAQSQADRTGVGIERARDMQSQADLADVKKHNQ
ncbi:hypothetical protein P4V86_11350 [Brevibacillus laterosporus]|nr:hypothetical protein [Brevibacillus laterosporus]MED2003946.1 hypothetical protein [Brevibacillus laterosporus]MED4765730.1 hypothetical protein [Brevibacillus laterosporus]